MFLQESERFVLVLQAPRLQLALGSSDSIGLSELTSWSKVFFLLSKITPLHKSNGYLANRVFGLCPVRPLIALCAYVAGAGMAWHGCRG